MSPLSDEIREYRLQLGKGHIQKAYRGIMTFMSDLRAYLENNHPDHTTGALYFGYMDMTYFAFTPAALKDRKLKIAIVFLHEACRFEAWLAGNNRQTQAETIATLSRKNTGRYALSQIQPGVDSIIAWPVAEAPDFDWPEELKKEIETKTMGFVGDMMAMLQRP